MGTAKPEIEKLNLLSMIYKDEKAKEVIKSLNENYDNKEELLIQELECTGGVFKENDIIVAFWIAPCRTDFYVDDFSSMEEAIKYANGIEAITRSGGIY